MDRLVKGLIAVLLVSAGVWLLVRAVRAPEATTAAAPPTPAAPAAQKTTVTVKEKKNTTTTAIAEGEHAIGDIPPIKLIRERKSTPRKEPPVPSKN